MLQENKARQIFRKMNISYPLICTRLCAYQGVRYVCFPENLTCFFSCNTRCEIGPFVLLPTSYFSGHHWVNNLSLTSAGTAKKSWLWLFNSQPAFSCSQSTMETPKRYLYTVQSEQQGHQNDINDVVLVSLLLTFDRFHTLFWCFGCWIWTSNCRLGSWIEKYQI